MLMKASTDEAQRVPLVESEQNLREPRRRSDSVRQAQLVIHQLPLVHAPPTLQSSLRAWVVRESECLEGACARGICSVVSGSVGETLME